MIVINSNNLNKPILKQKYGMYSREGDLEIQKLIDKILNYPDSITDTHIYNIIKKEYRTIKINHPECTDTVVREILIDKLVKETNRKLNIFFE